MTAGAAVTGGAEQIAQRAVAEEVQRLVGDFELDLGRLAVVAAAHRAPCLFGLEIGRRRNVARLLHAFDDLLDQLFELLARGVFVALGRVTEHLLEEIVRQHAAVEQRFENRVVQRLHRAIAVIAGVARVPEPARHQQVGQLRHQLVHVELIEQVGNVLRVFVFHSSETLKPSSKRLGHGFSQASVVIPFLLPPAALVLVLVIVGSENGAARLRLLRTTNRFGAVVAAQVAAADLLLRIQAFEQEVDGGGDRPAPAPRDRCRLARSPDRQDPGRLMRRAPASRRPWYPTDSAIRRGRTTR